MRTASTAPRLVRTTQRVLRAIGCLVALSTASAVSAAPAKVALIHSFPALGDVSHNVASLESLVQRALMQGANIVVTPELATTGFSITREQVVSELGFTSPYPELAGIEALARQYRAYVLVGIAEVTPTQQVYNTVVVLGPSGLVTTSEKRGLSGWHDRGVLPFEVIPTIYGDLGVMICSDVYLPDWIRILATEGADLVLLPANWFGSTDQQEIWQTRARENGIWFLTANRWGMETDTRFGTPFVYNMNDAPSAAITPDGEIQLFYRAMDVPNPVDEILLYDVDVPSYRIGTRFSPTYSLNFRRPGAYTAIANGLYDRDTGNQMAPGLPPDGTTRIASIAYQPNLTDAGANLAAIAQRWAAKATVADVVVLPGRGITSIPVATSNPAWFRAAPWTRLQGFVEANHIALLVTTLLEWDPEGWFPEALVLVQPGKAPILSRQIHDSLTSRGTGNAPAFIDLAHARVGVLTGRDALFPEAVTALAKSGADILVISSAVGAASTSHHVNAPAYFWEPAALVRMWKTRSNDNVHVAASDWTGNGVVIEETGGIIGNLVATNASNPVAAIDTITDSDPFAFDSVRVKLLNHYYAFDLNALLGP
jgi:predicted amidohydrolase